MSLKDFQLISKLGEGAYSSVYKVKRLQDNLEYALKKVKLMHLSEKEKENALNEVRILASIRHSNIVSYKEAFIDLQSNSLCIIMEYADRGDLFQKIVEHQKTGQNIKETDIWNVITQVAKGLKALHELKIMHRDLKSANVFLYENGDVKLGDMNVSKVAKQGLLYTQTGTPYYASPEVWKDQPYDYKSDIWSFGCVIYEMSTLKPPFRSDDMEGLYKKVIRGLYQKIPSQYSQDLSNLIRTMLQVTPHLRPTAEKLLQMPSVIKRMNEKMAENADDIQSYLLQTIKFPKKFHYLTAILPKPNYNPLKVKMIDKYQYVQNLLQKTEEDNQIDQKDEQTVVIRKQSHSLQISPLPASKNNLQSYHIPHLEDISLNNSQQSIKNRIDPKHLLLENKSRSKAHKNVISKSIDHDDRVSLNKLNSSEIPRDISYDHRSKIGETQRKRTGANSALEISPELSTYKKKHHSNGKPTLDEAHPYDLLSGQNSKYTIDAQKLPYLNPKRIEREDENHKRLMQNKREATRRQYLNLQQRNQSLPNTHALPLIGKR